MSDAFWVALFTGLPAIIAALAAAVAAWHSSQNRAATAEVKKQVVLDRKATTAVAEKVEDVQGIVNGHRTELVDRIKQLEDAFRAAGLVVPNSVNKGNSGGG